MSKTRWWIKFSVGLLLSLLLSGCSNSFGESIYDNAWFLGFGAPDYMEVWIETADVVDIQEQVIRGAGGGVASILTPPNNKGNASGWGRSGGGGAGRYVLRADLPRLIYVRWQSLVEPQTYEAYIVVPESVQRTMQTAVKIYCSYDNKLITDYRNRIGIGLAPGGIVKVSLGGSCSKAEEILRVKAEVARLGPYGGKSGGKHRPLSEVSKAYIEKFGIPYGSW